MRGKGINKRKISRKSELNLRLEIQVEIDQGKRGRNNILKRMKHILKRKEA